MTAQESKALKQIRFATTYNTGSVNPSEMEQADYDNLYEEIYLDIVNNIFFSSGSCKAVESNEITFMSKDWLIEEIKKEVKNQLG